MKTSKSKIVALCGLLLFFTACKQINKSIGDTLHGTPKISKEDAFFNHDADNDANKPNFLEDAHALGQAEASLRNLPGLKGKVVKMYGDMHMYNDRADNDPVTRPGYTPKR